jgi:hypothetical protein
VSGFDVVARWVERALAIAAAALVPLLLCFVSLPNVLALCDRWPVIVRARATPRALAQRVHRWLAHGGGPWAPSCLTRSLVLYVMLRQHGYQPRLVVGVVGTEQEFGAHAWVTLAGIPVADPPDVISGYTELLGHSA